MAKKIITLFFLLLFVTQLIPIREVGKLIAGATMTEELPETGTTKSNDIKWISAHRNLLHSIGVFSSTQQSYIHFSETLPGLMAGEVQTPPPNFFC